MRALSMASIDHTTSRNFLLPTDPEGGSGPVSFRSERGGHVPAVSRAGEGGAGAGPYVHLPSGDAKLSFFNEQVHDVLHAAASGRAIFSDVDLDLSPDNDVDLSWAWTNDTSGGYNLTGAGSYYYNLTAAVRSGDKNSTAAGHDDVFNWGMLALAPLVLFGIAGNTLVILAISLERRLQNVTNYFLLSLAVTDLLVSLIVMPLSIINEFTGRWPFGLELCNLFVTADVLMCTSSILHLCTISLERYVGIRYPLWAKNKSTRTVFLKIVLVWTLALAITSPITVLGLVSGDNIYRQHDQQCLLRNQHFIIYGSVLAFFIPLTIMVIMYALTVRMLNRQAKMCGSGSGGGGRDGSGSAGGSGEGQPMIRRSTSRRHWERQSRYGDAASGGGSLSYHHHHSTEPLSATSSYPLGGSNSRYTQRYQPLSKRNTVPLYPKRKRPPAPASASSSRGGVSNGNAGNSEYELFNGSSSQTPPSSSNSPDRGGSCWRLMGKRQMQHSNGGSREPKRLRELVRKHHVAVKAANILLMRKDLVRKETNAVHTEQKASKVLGVVFSIFVVCWAPFFLMNVLRVLCPDSCALSPTLFTVFVWLGYVSSTLNPIIYTVFNKVFKLTFLKLLCCRYGHLHRGRRRSAAAAPSPASALARGRPSQHASSSGLITCNSFCGHGGSNSMEESMC